MITVVVAGAQKLTRKLEALAEGADEVEVLSTVEVDQLVEAISQSPDAVLLAVEDASTVPHEVVSVLRERTTVPVILVVPPDSAQASFEEAAQRGLSDVIALPEESHLLAFALRKAIVLSSFSGTGQTYRSGTTITVTSLRGGAGRSTMATNLAATTAKKGLATLVVDLDPYGDIAALLDVDPVTSIVDLMLDSGDFDAEKLAGFTLESEAVPGVSVLAAPRRPQDASLIVHERIVDVLSVARASYDVVIVDTPATLDSATLVAIDRCDELIVLATPEMPAVRQAVVMLGALSDYQFPRSRTRFILNRDGMKNGVDANEVERAVGVRIHTLVPDDPNVIEGVNRAIPAVKLTPGSPISRTLDKLVHQLMPVRLASARPSRRRSLRFARSRRTAASA